MSDVMSVVNTVRAAPFDERGAGRKIIRDGAVVADDWVLVSVAESAAPFPAGKIIVPLSAWLSRRETLCRLKAEPNQPIGVWLDGADDPALLADSIDRLALIAVNFSRFADGRGFSSAALLRGRYGFNGELRAIGDVLRDQLFYLHRVGFNAFSVRADKDIFDAVNALKDFSMTYQHSIDESVPRISKPYSLQTKIARLRELLAEIEREFAPAAFANSFGAEDMVLTHLIASEFKGIEIFTLDTLRLPGETYALIDISRAKYGYPLNTYTPIAADVVEFEQRNGLESMYESVANRKSCCFLRKIEPLNRALAGKAAWLTGLRREQAPSRKNLTDSEFDADHNITKFNPLIDWSEDEVWAYIRANDVPYNALHDRDYPSIGCQPCTRAVAPGEDARAGRWWWEQTGAGGQQECGLHVKTVTLHAPTSRESVSA